MITENKPLKKRLAAVWRASVGVKLELRTTEDNLNQGWKACLWVLFVGWRNILSTLGLKKFIILFSVYRDIKLIWPFSFRSKDNMLTQTVPHQAKCHAIVCSGYVSGEFEKHPVSSRICILACVQQHVEIKAWQKKTATELSRLMCKLALCFFLSPGFVGSMTSSWNAMADKVMLCNMKGRQLADRFPWVTVWSL